MKFSLLLLLFISFKIHSQINGTLPLLNVKEGLSFVEKPTIALGPSCLQTDDEKPEVELESVCYDDEEKKNDLVKPQHQHSRLVYKITDINQLHSSFLPRIPIQDIEVSEKSPLYLAIALDNDNVLLGMIPSGDDKGYTHSLMIDIGGTTKKGITFGGTFYTGLYTKGVVTWEDKLGKKDLNLEPGKRGLLKDGNFYERAFDENNKSIGFRINGKIITDEEVETIFGEDISNLDWKTKVVTPDGKTKYLSRFDYKNEQTHDKNSGKRNQIFSEETILKLFANNHQQGKWYLWSVDMGFISINNNDFNSFLATGIQKKWHESLQAVSDVTQYNYLASGNDNKFGIVMAGSVGFQKDLFKSQRCVIKVNANAAQRFSSLSGATYSSLSTNLSTKFKLGKISKDAKKSLAFNVGATTFTEYDSIGLNLNAGVTYTTKNVILFTTIQKPLDINPSTTNYNDLNLIQRLGIFIHILKPKK